MTVQQGIGEKNGRLCFLEIERETGKYHYYPIMAKVDIFIAPDSRMVIPDPYLYVDRKNEI